MNNKALVFSIDNKYSFLLANVIMSLYDNSRETFNTSDFIIYHDGISEYNQKLLRELCNNLQFINFIDYGNFIPEIIYTHSHTKKWGKFIYQKLNCFNLVRTYEHVLWLDADILINGNIEDIFNCNADIAWRSVVSWRHKDIYNKEKYPFSHTLANSERAQLSDCYSFHSVVEA